MKKEPEFVILSRTVHTQLETRRNPSFRVRTGFETLKTPRLALQTFPDNTVRPAGVVGETRQHTHVGPQSALQLGPSLSPGRVSSQIYRPSEHPSSANSGLSRPGVPSKPDGKTETTPSLPTPEAPLPQILLLLDTLRSPSLGQRQELLTVYEDRYRPRLPVSESQYQPIGP